MVRAIFTIRSIGDKKTVVKFLKKIKYMDWGSNMDKLKLIPIKGNIKEQLKSQAIKRRLKMPDYIEYLVKKDKEKLDNK